MNNWLGRGILFLVVVTGTVSSLQYTASHFKPDRQLILLNRTRPDFHYFLSVDKQGNAGISRGSLKEYFDYFHLVTDAMPDNSDGILMRGYLEEITGDGPQAEALFKEADRLSPQFFFTEFDLAFIFFKQGDYSQSSDLLQKALSIPPNITLARMMNSMVYRQLFSSINNSSDIITSLRQAYNDAYVLLMESSARQKGSQGADLGTDVHAHIM